MIEFETIIAGIALSISAFFGYKATTANKEPKQSYTTPDRRDTDINILARTAWGEARGDGYSGMHAVCNVVINRFKQTKGSIGKTRQFGHTVGEVCLKPKQFSVWNKNDRNNAKAREVTTDDREFRQALSLAENAVDGDLKDITNGADHYHTFNILPSWAKKQEVIARIGNHNFYDLT